MLSHTAGRSMTSSLPVCQSSLCCWKDGLLVPLWMQQCMNSEPLDASLRFYRRDVFFLLNLRLFGRTQGLNPFCVGCSYALQGAWPKWTYIGPKLHVTASLRVSATLDCFTAISLPGLCWHFVLSVDECFILNVTEEGSEISQKLKWKFKKNMLKWLYSQMDRMRMLLWAKILPDIPAAQMDNSFLSVF